MYYILHMFSQRLFFAENHGNNEIWVPSMPPHHLSLIFIGMKQKKIVFNFWIENWWIHVFIFFNFSLAKLSAIDPHENVVDWCKGCPAFLKKVISDLKAKNAFYISNLHTYHVAVSGLACDGKEEII